MRRMMRSALIGLMMLCLTFALATGALAASDFTVDNGLLVAYSGPGGEVTVPSGVRVIGANAFAHNTEITRVDLPWTAHTIESFAFSGCTELTYVEGVNRMDSIGAGAFFGCAAMTNVYLPEDLTAIPSQLFYGCESMSMPTIPDTVQSIGASAFYGCANLYSVTLPSELTSIGDKAFSNCENLQNIVFPTSLTSVGAKAFYGCSAISRLTVLNEDMTIGASAFPQNAALTVVGFADSTAQAYAQENGITFETISESNDADDFSISEGRLTGYSGTSAHVIIPDGVTEIGSYVFQNNQSLLSVTMPDTVIKIGNSAFSGCSNLESVTLSASLESIGSHAFSYCKKLAAISLPDSLTAIDSMAFYNCRSLTSVSIPGNIDCVQNNAFNNCTALRSVTIGEGVTTIEYNAFSYCESLTSVSLPDSLTSVGDSVFYCCVSLEEITFPQNVVQVGNNVLSGCSALRSVTFENPDVQIGYGLLNSTNFPVVHGHYGSDAESVALESGCEFVGCGCCEPEVVCEHPNAWQTYSTNNETYTADGALLTHSITHDKHTYMYCPDCESRYNYIHETAITERANHNWNDAEICSSCGQQNTCTHANQQQHTYETNHLHAITGDLRTHITTYEIYGWTECLDCGLRLTEDEYISRNARTDNHWWDENNVCNGCKQANNCPHANINTWESHDQIAHVSTGDLKTHTYVYNQYLSSECEDCGFYFGRELVAEDVESTENHYWNTETNTCYHCKQENLCEHKRLSTSTYRYNVTYTSTGDYQTHTVTYDEYSRDYCQDCRLYFERELTAEGKTATEGHSWDENDVCYNCEQKNTCPHEDTYSYTRSRDHEYTSTGDVGYHDYTCNEYRIVRCNDCHKEVSETFEKTVTRKERHYWNANDLCYDCGQLNACEHTGATRESVSCETKYAQLDENLHTITQNMTVRIACEDCRKQIGTREGIEYVTEAAHAATAARRARLLNARMRT